jgi:hypothetical protein
MDKWHCGRFLFDCIVTTTLGSIVATMTLDRCVATRALDTIVAFDTVVGYVITSVALLRPSPVIWRTECLWNFSVLQRVHLSNLV